MKNIWIVILASGLLAGCGSNSNSNSGGGTTPTTTSMPGTWNVVVSQTGQNDVNLTALLAGGACSVADSSSGDTFSVQGPSCFLADNQTGVGHVSSTDSTLVPEGVLIGLPANPAADGSAINFLYAAIDASSNIYVFSGTGTVSGNKLTGSWSCYPNLAICTGETGTFTASKQ